MEPTLRIDPSLSPSPVRPALVWAEGLTPPFAGDGLPPFLAEIVARAAREGDDFWPDGRKKRVRVMLRHGRYRPNGRAKPASEFLLRAAVSDDFPAVCGPVDVNNAVSLESGLPCSVLDADLSGEELLLRRGLPGESYVFNTAGHDIALEDLLVVCRRDGDGWEPCGNPVKDSMATKIRPETHRVVAVIFAPADEPDESLAAWARRFAELLTSHCGAERTGVWLAPAAG